MMACISHVLRLSLIALVPQLGGQAVLYAAEKQAKQSPADVAARVDRELMRGLIPALAPDRLVDDETFLRRISIDLTGKLPDPESLSKFLADPAPDKRSAIVERHLKSHA